MTQMDGNSPPRNAPALAALALGVTGLILAPLLVGGLLGLSAIILGLVALRRQVRRGRAMAGIVTGMLAMLLALLAGTALVLGPRIVQRARENAAAANLRRLSMATVEYGAQWGGTAPSHMALLWPYLGDMARVIQDPRLAGPIRRRGWAMPPHQDEPAFGAALDQNSDFSYAAPTTLGDPRLITFYDRGIPGSRRLVAFADGRVERFAAGSADFRAAVERNNEAREKLHLPPLPPDLDGSPPRTTAQAPELPHPEK